MESQIRSKNQKYKDQFRRICVQSYRQEIRRKMLNHQRYEEETSQLNRLILTLIDQANMMKIYQTLYRGKILEQTEVPIMYLSQITLIRLMNYLKNNFDNIYGLLVMCNIIDIHFKLIFLNRDHQELCKDIVRLLYNAGHKLIQGSQIVQNQFQKTKMVNATLSCIKSLIFNKEEQSAIGYNFTESSKEQYLVKYLFVWLQKLISNPIYLIIVTIVEYAVDMSSIQAVKNYLNDRPKIIQSLLKQSDPQNNYMKSCALPSILLANSFVKIIYKMQTLYLLIIPYLQASKVIYSLTQKSHQQFYKINTFYDTINNVAYIFQQIKNQSLKNSLCQLMAEQSFWVFTTLILRTETCTIRELFYSIIQKAFHNLLANHGKLQAYLTQTLIGLIGEGLEQRNQDILVNSLQIFHNVFCYCNHNYQQTIEITRWIKQFDIQTVLENLVHSPHQKISSMAIKLLQAKNNFENHYSNEMALENI